MQTKGGVQYRTQGTRSLPPHKHHKASRATTTERNTRSTNSSVQSNVAFGKTSEGPKSTEPEPKSQPWT